MSNIKIIKAPSRERSLSESIRIFLGSIDMGGAEDWQAVVTKFLEECSSDEHKITIYNPRRDDWDCVWEQSIDNTQFYDQVTWELDNIEKADVVLVYFSEDSKAPITLLELGKVVESDKAVIVYCPKEFYRKGNVDIVCYRKDIPVAENMDELKDLLKEIIGIDQEPDKEDTKEDDNSEDDSREKKKEKVKESAKLKNMITIKTFSDKPTIKYTMGDEDKIIVEDFEKIDDSCMMGKLKFMGREIYAGICTENGVSKISLNVDIGNTGKEQLKEFIVRKSNGGSPEGIVLEQNILSD